MTTSSMPWRLLLAAAQNELPPRTPPAAGETPAQARGRIHHDFLALGVWRRANRERLDEGINAADGRGWTDRAKALCRAAGMRYDALDQAWAETWPSFQEAKPYPAARISYRRPDGTPWPPLLEEQGDAGQSFQVFAKSLLQWTPASGVTVEAAGPMAHIVAAKAA